MRAFVELRRLTQLATTSYQELQREINNVKDYIEDILKDQNDINEAEPIAVGSLFFVTKSNKLNITTMKKLLSFVLMCLMALSMSAQKCAVLEFRGSASVSVADIDGISEMFMTYFRPAGYTMIERAQIDKVISEQNFQRSNITDNQAVQLGKILNASIVILGKVSKLGGQYQVDVRAVNVQSGHDVALEGATFSGDYRTNVRNLATKLAGKVAITPAQTVQPTSPQPLKKRTTVEVVYGYLKVFPNELGVFEAEPSSVIAQINKQAQHGYNNWRIPTNEELSLLRANGYLANGKKYMSSESREGIVLLVTDGDDYATVKKAQEEVQRQREAAEEAARKAAEAEARKAAEAEVRKAAEAEAARKAQLRAQGWVDLGLPSGTLWKDKNEEGHFYTYDQAIAKFSNILPTKEQLEELESSCKWTWTGNGYRVEGPNGQSIFLPAAGYRNCSGSVSYVGVYGYYWSSTPDGSYDAWELSFSSRTVVMYNYSRCRGLSVRLVR